MERESDLDDLIALWTLLEDDRELLVEVHPGSRLSFAVLMKFFECRGRFPRHPGEVPAPAVEYLAKQVGADSLSFEVTGRTPERFRARVRERFGFRVFARSDEEAMSAWLAEHVCPGEPGEDQQRAAVAGRCRQLRLEPPGRVDRILGAANAAADAAFCASVVKALDEQAVRALWDTLTVPAGQDASRDVEDTEGEEEESQGREAAKAFFTELKEDPGRLGLETLLTEIAKLQRLAAPGVHGRRCRAR